MKQILQESDFNNIYYIGIVLWHCGIKEEININLNYNFKHIDKVFQNYNPGSNGYGAEATTYALPFFNYFNAIE